MHSDDDLLTNNRSKKRAFLVNGTPVLDHGESTLKQFFWCQAIFASLIGCIEIIDGLCWKRTKQELQE